MWGLAVVIALYFYIRFAIWIARKLAGKRESKRWKWGVRSAVALMLILVPTVDSILGHLYFNHLCSTEAGAKVYQTVELPAEYWDGQGRARFFKENGDLNHSLLMDRFSEPSTTKSYSSFFKIDERHQQLVDKSNHVVLGEVVNFMYWGGWVTRNFSPHNTSIDCEDFHGNKFWHDFYVRFFKPATSTR